MKKILLMLSFIAITYRMPAQNVGIGISTPASKLHIKGAVNATQLIVDANATQSNANPLFKLRKSDGTDLVWIHSDNPSNTFIGLNAGRVNNLSTGAGLYNTFLGGSAGYSNTTGNSNTANGYSALYSNTTGGLNTANGGNALYSNSSGTENIAIGNDALYSNTTGSQNIAIGKSALFFNTTSSQNTAIGKYALLRQSYDPGSTWNSNNTAVGYDALFNNQPTSTSNGVNNTALGHSALRANTTGYGNTAIGYSALSGTTGGLSNVAVGDLALENNVGGADNIALGSGSGTGASAPNINNTISIGNKGYLNTTTNYARIGNMSTAWTGGNTTWFTYASDSRVKNNVKEDVSGLAFIKKLRPVTYNLDIRAMTTITGNKETEDYPGKYDVEKIQQSGFLAQEVEQAAKESGYDFSGITVPKRESELYTISYSQFVVPLVKAVQEQQAIIEEQNKKIEALMRELQIIKEKLK